MPKQRKRARSVSTTLHLRSATSKRPWHSTAAVRLQTAWKDVNSAFIDLGDQFLALPKGRRQAADDGRHFGLVVDDKEAVRKALSAAGIEPLPGRFLDFLDPWGNRIEIVGYETSNSPRPRTFCTAWACRISRRARRRSRNSPTREWRRAKCERWNRQSASVSNGVNRLWIE